MRYTKLCNAAALGSLAFGLLLSASPVNGQSQRFEVTPFFGQTTAGALNRTAEEVTSLEVSGGFTWGAQFGYFFHPRMGVELSWTRQETHLGLSTPSGSARLFDMQVGRLHGDFIYQFADADAMVKLYVLAGIGTTFFSSTELPSESKLSFALGGGVKWLLREHIGAKFQAKYTPTRLNDGSSGDFCDPFGFCSDTLHQFELGAGVVLRF